MCKSCFLFGHRDTPQEVLPALEDTVLRYYLNYGVRHFYVGNRGDFDRLAITALRRVKQKHTDIRLFLVLAYHPAERSVDITDGFDGTYYPPLENTPRQYAIVKANRFMVEQADAIICYVKHIGNGRNLLEYAKSRKNPIVYIENLAEHP